MLDKDYTAKLLNLEDVIITNVENISGEVHVYLELPRAKHRCPACEMLTDRVHDYRMQTIKDVPLGRTTLLHLRKRRYRCDCGKRFFEENAFLPRYHRAPAVWLPRSSTRSVKLYLPQKSAHSLTFPAQPQCGISSMSRSSQPSSPRFFLLMSLREIPAAKSTTVSS